MVATVTENSNSVDQESLETIEKDEILLGYNKKFVH